MNIGFFIILIIAAAGGSYVIYLSLRKQGARLEDMKAVAVENGWTFDHTPAGLNKGSQTTFASAAENWTMTYWMIAGSGSSVQRHVEWHTLDCALSEGSVVLGPPLKPQTVAMLDGPIPDMAAKMIKKLMLQYLDQFRDLAKDMTLDEGTMNDPRGVVMATSGQATRLNPVRDNALLAAARDGKTDMMIPIVIRDQTGLRIRIRGALGPVDQLKMLADLGNALRSDLQND